MENVSSSGELYGWGDGESHVLGTGVAKQELAPRWIASSPDPLMDIAAGSRHSLGVSSTGMIYSWGQGAHGVLGHGNEDTYLTPTRIQGFEPEFNATSVSASDLNTAAIGINGELYLWGVNSHRQIGLGSGTEGANRLNIVFSPRRCIGLKDHFVHRVALGPKHVLALVTTTGRRGKATHCAAPLIFGWGTNEENELGPSEVIGREVVDTPIPLPCQPWGEVLGKWPADVSATLGLSYGVSNLGELCFWGKGKPDPDHHQPSHPQYNADLYLGSSNIAPLLIPARESVAVEAARGRGGRGSAVYQDNLAPT